MLKPNDKEREYWKVKVIESNPQTSKALSGLLNFETDGRLVLKVYETDDRDSWK